jgi:hypothetical protein
MKEPRDHQGALPHREPNKETDKEKHRRLHLPFDAVGQWHG